MMQKFPYFQSRSNSTDDTVPYFNSSLKGLSITSSGALMNNYCASGDNHHGNETELVLPSRLSHAPNYYASSTSVTLSGVLMPTSVPLSRPIDNVNFNDPLGHAPYGGSTGSCQFDVEAVQGFIKRYPYLSEHFLETMKDHNHSNHPVSCVICSVCPCYMMNNILEHLGFFPRTRLDTKKLLGMERPIFTSLLLPPPLHSQFTVPTCPNKYIKALTSGRENKRCCLCRDLADEAMKRLGVSSISQVYWVGDHPPQKELLLFKDSYNSDSGSEIPTGGEEKCEDNLDLSLHL
ncbi:hypothetical protein K1719_035728 [Acacia pycnantha]|nr:hypothetical protein K1719_035645 [Acacia pycnantha]KAI9082305.1 hypothetical protein K1719_035728 [Acacia pycnantha]